MRETQFFAWVHGAAGRLLAVAQGCVEEDDLIGVRHKEEPFRLDLEHNVHLCSKWDVCEFLMRV